MGLGTIEVTTYLDTTEVAFGDVPDDLVESFVGEKSDVSVGVVAQSEEHVHRGAQVLRQLG